MALENKGFATEQIDAPEAILDVTDLPPTGAAFGHKRTYLKVVKCLQSDFMAAAMVFANSDFTYGLRRIAISSPLTTKSTISFSG